MRRNARARGLRPRLQLAPVIAAHRTNARNEAGPEALDGFRCHVQLTSDRGFQGREITDLTCLRLETTQPTDTPPPDYVIPMKELRSIEPPVEH